MNRIKTLWIIFVILVLAVSFVTIACGGDDDDDRGEDTDDDETDDDNDALDDDETDDDTNDDDETDDDTGNDDDDTNDDDDSNDDDAIETVFSDDMEDYLPGSLMYPWYIFDQAGSSTAEVVALKNGTGQAIRVNGGISIGDTIRCRYDFPKSVKDDLLITFEVFPHSGAHFRTGVYSGNSGPVGLIGYNDNGASDELYGYDFASNSQVTCAAGISQDQWLLIAYQLDWIHWTYDVLLNGSTTACTNLALDDVGNYYFSKFEIGDLPTADNGGMVDYDNLYGYSPRNNALVLDGQNGAAATQTAFHPDFIGDFTIEGWFWFDSAAPGDTEFLISQRGDPKGKEQNGYFMTHQIGSDKGIAELYFCVHDGNSFSCAASEVDPPANEWVHVAGTWEDAENIVQVYLNGQPGDALSNNDEAHLVSAPVRIGHDPSGCNLSGKVDEVRLSSTLRYDGPFTPADYFRLDEDTVALYRFSEGTGTTAADSAPNQHDLNLTGGYSWGYR